jgi:hypothetical protein
MAETIIERNDVDINPLFAWSKEFEVTSNGQVFPVYMRLLGDADMNRARVAALRKSAELRKKLKDLDSDERVAFIKDIDDIPPENLIAVVTVFSMRDLSEKAQSKLKIKPPKQPRSDAKTAGHEKYQELVDSYPARRQAELRELLDKEVAIMRDSLTALGKEEVYRRYVAAMIDEMCEQELLKEFRAQCCYYGCYKNPELTDKLFANFEEFNNLQATLKDQFLAEYQTMELQGDDLKKLQRVTQ